MNGPHTPAFRRDNRWTRLIERVGEQNAIDGKPAGRMIEQIGQAQPLISAARVRRMSPEEQRRTDFVPEPEDPRIAMMSNARAAAMGLSSDSLPQLGDDLPGDIGHVGGEPTDAEIDQMLAIARGAAPPGVATAAEGAAAPVPGGSGIAAAGRVALPRGAAPKMGLAGPRTMPDFANVEGFDLTRKVAVVDGMEFRITDEDVVAMKKFAIQVVLDNITFQVAQALTALGLPEAMAAMTVEKMREAANAATGATPGGMDGAGRSAEVQSLPGTAPGTAVPGVPPVSSESDDPESNIELPSRPTTVGPQVQSDSAGSSERPAQERIVDGPPDDLSYLFGDG